MGHILDTLFRSRRFNKRYHVINFFSRVRKLTRYLEIGTSRGRCIETIHCKYKVGVDPNITTQAKEWRPRNMPSDEFFSANEETFDLVFIDGLHHDDQVLRDIYNSLSVLNDGGVILLHDCNPQTETAQGREMVCDEHGNWNGDVWKAITVFREVNPDVYCRVLDFDQGVGIIVPDGKLPLPFSDEISRSAQQDFDSLTWDDLVANRKEFLGLLDSKRELLADMKTTGIPLHTR